MPATPRKRNRSQYKIIGHLGVDAGLMYLGDPCYIPDTKDWQKFLDENINDENKLSDVPAWPIDRRGPSPDEAIDFGLVVTSGMGDGIYPVIAKISNGRIVSVTIDFDPYDAMPPE